MNEIEDFLAQVDAVLKRLDLPSLFLGEPTEEDTHELLRQRLALCFPNLTAEEQRTIRRMHILARMMPHALTSEAFANGDTDPTKLAVAKEFLQAEYADHVHDLDAFGMRARLSEFQEKLLDHLLQVRPLAEN